MSRVPPDITIDALVALLGDLSALHVELAVVLREKLAAMKRADVAAIQSVTAREGFLLDRAAGLDRRRQTVVTELARALRLPATESVTVTRILNAAVEPHRSALRNAAHVLRRDMLETANLQRVVSLVSGEMLSHFRNVFAAVTRSAGQVGIYRKDGRAVTRGSLDVLDAVG